MEVSMKKSIHIFIFFLLLICFSSIFAQSTEIIAYTSGDWDFVENETGITLTAWHSTAEVLEFPTELDEMPVTALGNELCKNHSELKRVIIPDNVTVIGTNVFNGCVNLTDVQLPLFLTRIETGIFRYCISLERIEIPFSVTYIGPFAFCDCVSLQEISLLSVTSIGESAFDNCQKLESVMLSRKLTSVGGYAFRDTPWLDAQTEEFVMIGKGVLVKWNGTETSAEVEIPYGVTMISGAFADAYFIESVTIPETVTQIGQYAFRDALNLKRVNIPEYVTTIGGNAFDGCRKLETVELPKSVKSLGWNVFNNCSALTSLTIPPQVTSIPGYILANCPKLTDVIIPESVRNIHQAAFQNSPNVRLYVSYGSEAERLLQEYGMPYSNLYEENSDFIYSRDEDGIRIVKYVGDTSDVEIPAEIDGLPVIAVDKAAFQNNRHVRSIIVPLTVKTIEAWAFSYMENLQVVQLASGLEQLGANAFTGSATLREVKLPQSLTAIGETPFEAETGTLICAAEGTDVAQHLAAMGYVVQPEDACTGDGEVAALWFELSAANPDASSGSFEIVKIPAGLSELTADLLKNTAENLILVIPADVTQIGEEILESHNILTIVSESGSGAEAFAREHGIKFLLHFEFKVN